MQQPPPPPAVSIAPARETNTLAVASLVAGVAGYVLPHPFVAGIVAIVTGHLARQQIKSSGEGGSGLALAGLVLGYVHLALSILLVVGLVLLLVFGIWSFNHRA